MAVGVSLQLSHDLGVFSGRGRDKPFKRPKANRWRPFSGIYLSSCSLRQDIWNLHVSSSIYRKNCYVLNRDNYFMCRAFAIPSSVQDGSLLKSTTSALTRSYEALLESPVVIRLAPAVGIVVFAVWGLGPVLRFGRNLFHNDNDWKKSRTHYVFTSYLQPLLLWTGATFICRTLDPVVLPSEASQVVKQRFLNFVRSLSTVLAFAYCLSSLIQGTQKFFMEKNSSDDSRNMGFQFAGRAVYTAVWIAAISLFMELLGFSTQKWITAGGLGTVLLTLAGREIFTNFLSSVMIHATRPFVVNEWIQTKIEGYEVSGTVEHVGWWSPTIIRGDDREAVHIPNHKFTVSVVRNLSQKTHWRIKTHLAINHLDVNKISNIVADMRKVLAKNPQIEQQRLHRRVFLDNINSENQALLVLISCFVKTSHFEEYLCVKEAVLLDLMRVISHHGARLATPIRTVQKIYGDAAVDNVPYAETIFTHAGTANRPLLLIEPPQSRSKNDEKTKLRSTPRANEEQTTKASSASDPKVNSSSDALPEKHQQQKKGSSADTRLKTEKSDSLSSSSSPSKAATSSHSAAKTPVKSSNEKSTTESVNEQVDGAPPPASPSKNDGERSPSNARSTFEDNIVLGVALEGSKRTLPIEEVIEAKEVGAARNGNGTPAMDRSEMPNKDR